eukprot:CAMPEP_0119102336 /NCGR_PEP_ID=MMETSP1180-20130426/1117_1 /TAXON_ID=3052 ORGANISM="Chlamydomonas cf sp, Strain CCMP681" /NCGR_SAMPLE_ID=MMETSP1180 /ASSEMBLY_ACC=CAM_ASM_000741 /LENGTH=94 /DNA_ID=CAMNT_0007086597 /DNA_START=68 /DNA_END=350 /DNA_ORIENTATION=-
MRVLYLACSPDGTTVVTGAGDETLRFWTLWPGARSQGHDTGGMASMARTMIGDKLASHHQGFYAWTYGSRYQAVRAMAGIMSSVMDNRNWACEW